MSAIFSGRYEPQVEGVVSSGEKLSLSDVNRLAPILTIDRMLEKTRIVVCSEQAAGRIRERVPHDVEVILADRRLDTGGVDLLRDVLAQLDGERA